MRASAQSDFEPRWKVKHLLVILLTNLLPLFLVLYGLKCIATLQGQLTEPGRYVMGSFTPTVTGAGDPARGAGGSAAGHPWQVVGVLITS